ncbi:hypothetical protein [Streptomyces caniscabiei]|uniref:Uncharacterized protein n=1 Tax=Streptomyces caniscabiei TaxID=2746961 RepID=A0A927L7I5_9ACTN|nr:hypothetical protein [Streptomyces caniscabiei]MBD9723968.1 hypothetical protein [Streptomyces caniscabiei]MDX3511376.1 hypothetical protein [Streptomyces caniscabiei]MDX3718443.1 hypothetical protein [Streptomyces caniscabiei]MDX3727093.1 hypothetical protein [Streptomyces caniscabiei]WEO22150.1 hypothetical protein IHE65_02785 [Streptomyces caniscabiei]
MAAGAPAGLGFVRTESLWDCESGGRLTTGIAHAPDLPHARKRPAESRDDPMQETGVRAAAGKRLVTGVR